MSCTSVSVASSVGPVFGITPSSAVRPVGSSCGGATASTPSVFWISAVTCGTAASGGLRGIGGDDHREPAGEAGAEALPDQFVG